MGGRGLMMDRTCGVGLNGDGEQEPSLYMNPPSSLRAGLPQRDPPGSGARRRTVWRPSRPRRFSPTALAKGHSFFDEVGLGSPSAGGPGCAVAGPPCLVL